MKTPTQPLNLPAPLLAVLFIAGVIIGCLHYKPTP